MDHPYRKEGNAVRRCIDHIHDVEKFTRYDYFRNYFCYYYLKVVAQHYLKLQNRKFWNAQDDHSKYGELFQSVFPTATIHPYKDRLDQMREYVEQQLAGDPMREFSKDQILQHVAALNRIFFDTPDEYLEKPNSLLKLIGYKVNRVSKDSKKPGYYRWRYCQIEPHQLAS